MFLSLLRSGFRLARLQDRSAVLHPSSVLALFRSDEPIQCIIYEELVKTSRYFVKGVSIVNAQDVIDVSPRFSERCRLRDLSKRRLVPVPIDGVGPGVRRILLAGRGLLLQDLERRLNATFELPDDQPGLVRIWTTDTNAEFVAAEFASFRDSCAEKIRNETMEVALPALQVRAVMGSGGEVPLLLLRNQFRKAILRNLPPNFNWNENSLSVIAGLTNVRSY